MDRSIVSEKNKTLLKTLKGKVTLTSLAAMIMVAAMIAFSGHIGNQRLQSEIEQKDLANAKIMYQTVLNDQFQWLQHQLDLVVLRLEDIVTAVQSRDREALEIASVPAYNLMQSKGNFSKLTFYIDRGVAFFRAHEPAHYGDSVTKNRKLVRDAFKEKKTEFGIEVDNGKVNLFLLQPLYKEGVFLGVVEAGGDFQPFLEELKRNFHHEVDLLVKKEWLPGVTGTRMVNNLAVLASTNADQLFRAGDSIDFSKGLEQEDRVTHKDGKETLETILLPLREYGGKTIGVIAMTSDITPLSHALSETFRRSLWIALLGLCLASGFIFLSLRKSFRPLNTMAELLKDLADGEGDLTRRIEVTSHEEIQDLSNWMNTFIESIQAIVSKIKETITTVADSAQQIIVSTDKVNSGAQEQNTAITEISQAMASMAEINQEVVSNTGNLAQHTEEASSSIMEMGASIDEVADNTKETTKAIEESVAALAEMLQSINEISANIGSLSANAEQTTSSTVEIARTIREVEKNAQASLEMSQEAVAKANVGLVVVDKTKSGMDKIKETFDQTARVIQNLGERSAAIGKILKIIDEVADQTSLLALNAAIIAAQAGEHGKGFAVVADEIKALAERSARSSRDIAEVIKNVQKDTSEAGTSMEVSSASITEGMDLARQAGEALQEIVQSVERSSTMIEEIAHATVEQNKGSQTVQKAISNITESLRQISKGTQEQKKGSEQIMKNSEHFRGMALHVSRAMEEQSKGSGQISKAIEEINYMSQVISKSATAQADQSQMILSNIKKIVQIDGRNNSQIQEMTAAIAEMTKMVDSLQMEINQFKV
jgi:methyl-accepting chemotaxis protein